MSGIETKIQIDQVADSKNIRYSTVTPEFKSSPDVDDIYRKDILAKGINFSDTDNTKIIKLADGTFLIGKKNGEYIDAVLKVGTSELLKTLITYSIDKFNRDELTKLGGEVSKQFTTEYKTYTDAATKKQVEEIVIKTTEGLNELKNEIISLDDIKELLATLIGGDYTVNGVKKHTDGQYNEITALLKKQKKLDKIQKANVEIFQDLLDTAQDKHLNQISKDIKAIKDNDFKENHAEAASIWKAKLEYIHAQFTQIEKYILDTDLMKKPFDRTIYNIETAAYSTKDVKKLLKKLSIQDQEEKDINELEFNAALTKIDTEDQNDFRVYLNDVLNGTIDPNEEAYVPKNTAQFTALCQDYPFLKGYICFECKRSNTSATYTEKRKNTGAVVPMITKNGTTTEITDNTITTNTTYNKGTTTETYTDYKEALKKGGLSGEAGYWLDQTKMNKEQKQFRGGVGNLAVAAGTIFIGWKMISSAFKLLTGSDKGDTDEKKAARRKDRAWLYGPAAIMFTSQAVTGEGPMGLIKGGAGSLALGNLLFGKGTTTDKDKVSTEKVSTENLTYAQGYPGLTALFAGDTDYKTMKSYMEKDGERIKLSETGYATLHDKYSSGAEKNDTAIAFLDEIGKDDDKHIIDLALDAMNITWDGMDKTSDKKFNVTASNNIARLASIEPFMDDPANTYVKINPDTMRMVKNYIKGKKIDGTEDENLSIDYLKILAKRGDVFLEEETLKDEANVKTQIEAITTDKDKQEALLIAMNAFYDNMPNATKDIKLTGTRPDVTFKTYDQETKIQLEKKELVGYTPADMGSYLELFKVASLTNYIKKICKDKVAKEVKPFYLSLGKVFFNDASIFSTDFDTEIIKSGSLEDISPTISKSTENKQKYCDYLNKMVWKIEQPVVKKEPETPKYTNLDARFTALGADTATLAALSTGISKFHEYMPSSTKNEENAINISGTTLDKVEFETYGEKTTVNLKTKTIKGLEGSAAFTDYFELFKAASLTNYLKKICKSKETKKGLPYYVSGSDIGFHDKNGNVDLISGGRFNFFSTLDKISPVLASNKQKYADYLNTTRDRTGNGEKIKTLSGGNQETELKILNSMNLFYEKMPSDKRDNIKISGTMDSLTFTTYGQSTTINLNTRSIKNLGVVFPDDKSDNYLELLKATSLTNRIKDIFKDYEGTDKPFNISRPGGDIEFEKRSFWKRDTEAISAGRWGSLGDVSPTLNTSTNKGLYENYLNSVQFRK